MTGGPYEPAVAAWLAGLLVSAGAAALVTPAAARLAVRLGAIDRPDARKQHPAPTPLFGGVAVCAGVLAGLVATGALAGTAGASRAAAGQAVPPLATLLAGATAVFAAGLADDVRPLSSRVRLAAQLAGALLAMAGGLRFALLPAGLPAAGAVNGLLTLLWIVGITNAVNFLDGIDGLAASLAAVTAACLGATAYLAGDPAGALAAAVAGASLGFLPFNLRPHRPAAVFLGDAGSTLLGFLLACLGLAGRWHEERLAALATPLLALALPIYDMVYTTVARLRSGAVRSLREWLDYVGRDHLHHRLMAIAGSRGGALAAILGGTAILGVAAVAAAAGGAARAGLLVAHAVLLLVLAAWAEGRAARRGARGGEGRAGSPLALDIIGRE